MLLFNRDTKRLRTLATASGKAAVFAGQVRGDYATWYSWSPERSNVFRYRISTKKQVKLPKPAVFTRQHGSSVGADGTVYYQRRRDTGCGNGTQLVMYPLGGPAQVLHDYPAGTDGGRTVLDPPAVRGELNFTKRNCRAPAARATDGYTIRVPANPAPEWREPRGGRRQAVESCGAPAHAAEREM